MTILQEKKKYFLQPGYIFTSIEPYLVSTVLGSCVSVCIWDEINKFGGINHYVYPRPFNKETSAQFGTISIPYMLNLIIKMGANKNNLKAHIIGGAQNSNMNSFVIGKQNIETAEKILREKFIPIITQDTGGEMGRKVVFDTETGEVVSFKVHDLREYDWYDDKSSSNR